MTDVRLSSEAVKDLDHMIASHSLPLDTRERVRRRLEPLERFPRLGKELGGRWQSLEVEAAIRFRRRPHELDVLRHRAQGRRD